MDEFEISKFSNKVIIPRIFKTYVSEEYFQNCISCNKYLLTADSLYVIEKAIKNDQIEFEYAICIDCAEKIRKKLSPQSLKRIGDFFDENVNISEKTDHLLMHGFTSVDECLSACMVTGSSISDLDEYQIFALCEGGNLLLSLFPYMISHAAIEEMQELLSSQTKDELDDFTNRHFDLPP
jgi:hypothetical protein